MADVKVEKQVTVTITLGEAEAQGLRDLLSGGVSAFSLEQLGLDGLEGKLTNSIPRGHHEFREYAKLKDAEPK